MGVNINLDLIPQHIHTTITRLINLTRFGIQSCNEKTHFNIEEPDPNFLTMPPLKMKYSLQEIKEEYIKWVIKNALCQAIESVNITFDNIYLICLILRENKTIDYSIENDKLIKMKNKFHTKGFPEKGKIIGNEFKNNLLPISFEHLLTINKARNCLVHRNGIISEMDYNYEESFIIKWKALDIYFLSGNIKQKWEGGLFKGEKGEAISMRYEYVDREKMFEKNDVISFSEKEFSEICMFFSIFANDLHKLIIQFAIDNGYQLNLKEKRNKSHG